MWRVLSGELLASSDSGLHFAPSVSTELNVLCSEPGGDLAHRVGAG
jgi:hypothetical protein